MAWAAEKNTTPVDGAVKKRKNGEWNNITKMDNVSLAIADLTAAYESQSGDASVPIEQTLFRGNRIEFAQKMWEIAHHPSAEDKEYCSREDAIDAIGRLYGNTEWVKDNGDNLVATVSTIFDEIQNPSDGSVGLSPQQGAKGFHRVALAMWRLGGKEPFVQLLNKFPGEHKLDLFDHCYRHAKSSRAPGHCNRDKQNIVEFCS